LRKVIKLFSNDWSPVTSHLFYMLITESLKYIHPEFMLKGYFLHLHHFTNTETLNQ
jgi:hypothetical protein